MRAPSDLLLYVVRIELNSRFSDSTIEAWDRTDLTVVYIAAAT
jgi:hypothetical protein